VDYFLDEPIEGLIVKEENYLSLVIGDFRQTPFPIPNFFSPEQVLVHIENNK
jgi:hypothetical protein